MQRAIIAVLDGTEGGKTGTKALMFKVGKSLESQGRNIFMDLSDPAYGPLWCYWSAFYVSFYRALGGLDDRGLVTWYKGSGGPGKYDGMVVYTPKKS
jgi:hypothetical protein